MMRPEFLFLGVTLFLGVIILIGFATRKKDNAVSTTDDTTNDLSDLSDFITALPVNIQTAIAEGTLSLRIEWAEVTRDEDDEPTIKPRIVLTSTKGETSGAAIT